MLVCYAWLERDTGSCGLGRCRGARDEISGVAVFVSYLATESELEWCSDIHFGAEADCVS